MTFYLIMFGGMVLFGSTIALLDWLGQRQERRRRTELALASGRLDQLATEARRLSGLPTKKEAVTEALLEYIRRRG